MFAVVVQFEIAPESWDKFLPLMHKNARASLDNEPGCRRFDVLTDPKQANVVMLYELYDDATAFDDHRATDHFKAFDRETMPMVATKSVSTWTEVAT